jgi:hypothetical protein
MMYLRLTTSLLLLGRAVSFVASSTSKRSCRPTFLSVSRYGPPSSLGNDMEEERDKLEMAQRKVDFRNLLETSMAVTNPDHLPQIFGRNLELILSLQGEEGSRVVSELVEEAKEEGQEQFEQVVTLVEVILSFAEDFVEQASEMDGSNKKLLGKIIRAMTSKDIESARDREEYLDELMEQQKAYFTPGFLRHIDGECDRIAGAPKMTPESARLMEIMRIIQTRVLEELGKDMGEATVVLGQLMGYDDKNELLGVLDAGLTVRGMDFCQELKALTEEALDGFQRVNGGVDPELVEKVALIDKRLRSFIDKNNEFQ